MWRWEDKGRAGRVVAMLLVSFLAVVACKQEPVPYSPNRIEEIVKTIESSPQLIAPIAEFPPEYFVPDEVFSYLVDMWGCTFWKPIGRIRYKVAATRSNDVGVLSNSFGRWRFSSKGSDGRCRRNRRLDLRLVPGLQNLLMTVLDKDKDIEDPHFGFRQNDNMDLTRGLVESLGSTPHVSSLDVLTRALECAGLEEEVVAELSDYPDMSRRQVVCDQSFQRMVYDALYRCTNGALDRTRQRNDEWSASLSEPESKELRDWLGSWSVLRAELEDRGILGDEPDWGDCVDSGKFMWEWIDSFEDEVDTLENLPDGALDERVEHLFRALPLQIRWRFLAEKRSIRKLCQMASKLGANRTLRAMVKRARGNTAREKILASCKLPDAVAREWAESIDFEKNQHLVSLSQYIGGSTKAAREMMASNKYSLRTRCRLALTIARIGNEEDIAFLRSFYTDGAPYEARCPYHEWSDNSGSQHTLAGCAEYAAGSIQKRLGLPESILMRPERPQRKPGERIPNLWDVYRNDPRCPKPKFEIGSLSPFGEKKSSGANCY